MSSRILPDPAHVELATCLQAMQARGENARLNAYLARLVEHGWPKVQLGEFMDISRQAVGARIRHAHTDAADLEDLPLPAPPPSRKLVPPTRTESGLRVPDSTVLIPQAEADMQRWAAGLRGDQLEILRSVAHMLEEYSALLSDLEQQRASLAWSMTCYDRQRGLQKAGAWNLVDFHNKRQAALGKTAQQLKAMSREDLAELAEHLGFPRYSNPAEQYYEVAAQIITTRASIRAAREIRNELVRNMVTSDPATGAYKGVAAAAEAIGRNAGTIWHIVHGPDGHATS